MVLDKHSQLNRSCEAVDASAGTLAMTHGWKSEDNFVKSLVSFSPLHGFQGLGLVTRVDRMAGVLPKEPAS